MGFIKNKVALITGGASGLGFGYANELLKNGLKGVTLADIDADKGQEAFDNLVRAYGPNKVIFRKVDVTNKTDFEDAMKATVEAFGNFDILINNAGIANDVIWERQIDINLKGTVNGCLLAFEQYLPKHRSTSEALIVNIASNMGLKPYYFMPVYVATKYAVVALSKVFACPENYETKKVRIITVCPGATITAILDDLHLKTFTPRLSSKVEAFLKDNPSETPQRPEAVTEAMVKIIETGENGSIWVVQRGQTYQVEVPNQENLKVLKRL